MNSDVWRTLAVTEAGRPPPQRAVWAREEGPGAALSLFSARVGDKMARYATLWALIACTTACCATTSAQSPVDAALQQLGLQQYAPLFERNDITDLRNLSLLDNKLIFNLVKMVPFKYIIVARLMNTIKDSRDIEASPHYRKYLDGALRVISIKKHLRLLRSGKSNSNDDHNAFPPSGLIESDSYS